MSGYCTSRNSLLCTSFVGVAPCIAANAETDEVTMTSAMIFGFFFGQNSLFMVSKDFLTVSDVTFTGSVGDETKLAFVNEVERVGRDSVYWVRREACFAVGALAKVVPQEVVMMSLVSCHHNSVLGE